MGYSSGIYDSAKKTMENRRLLAEEELDNRRDRLYRKAPRTQEIERELVHISVSAARSVLSGADKTEKLTELRDKSLSLQSELTGILRSLGLPENYLDPWYQCSDCRDTGYIDGRMCSCMKHLLRQTAYEELNRSSPLSLCGFDSFSVDYYSKDTIAMGGRTVNDYMNGVYRYCRRYADQFDSFSEGLIFMGGTGLGKTHLSLAIAREVIEKGFGVIYVSAPNILSRLETSQFGGRSDDRIEDEQLLQECDLLIIDDLGTEFVTKFTQAAIYNIINTRLNSGKPVIISTNLSTKELENIYGTRMVSRIVGMLRRIDFFGCDIRQLKRTKKAGN